jgi:hypothetical protein
VWSCDDRLEGLTEIRGSGAIGLLRRVTFVYCPERHTALGREDTPASLAPGQVEASII